MKKIILVVGAKYHEKVNGNTYHNAKIIVVENEHGTTYKTTYYTGYKYGYDNAYLYTASEYIQSVLNIKDFELIDGGAFYLPYRQVKNGQF